MLIRFWVEFWIMLVAWLNQFSEMGIGLWDHLCNVFGSSSGDVERISDRCVLFLPNLIFVPKTLQDASILPQDASTTPENALGHLQDGQIIHLLRIFGPKMK